jgi:hypothetical protein
VPGRDRRGGGTFAIARVLRLTLARATEEGAPGGTCRTMPGFARSLLVYVLSTYTQDMGHSMNLQLTDCQPRGRRWLRLVR